MKLKLKMIKKIDDVIKLDKVDKKVLTKIIALESRKAVMDRFDKGVGANNIAWKPSKKKNGKTLIDSGNLRNSIFKKYTNTYGGVATNTKYARIQNYGGTIHFKTRKGSVTIPDRPFFGYDEELKDKIAKKILKNISRGIEKK